MKVTRIEHIAFELDGQRYFEGKITRDIEAAKEENSELTKDLWKKYGQDPEFISMETELLF